MTKLDKKHLVFFCNFLFLFLLVLGATWLMIYLHTPVFSNFTFDFSCPTSTVPCEARINDQQKSAFKQNFDSAISRSHRLGKLSEVYMSVIRFQFNMFNRSDVYITIPPEKSAHHLFVSVQCENAAITYDSSQILQTDYSLSDSPDALLATSVNFIQGCTTLFAQKEDLKILPTVPPNAVVAFDYGPKFLPTLKPDAWSWVIVFIFNLFIILGLLPLAREGFKFINHGFQKYFDSKFDSK